MTDDVERMVTCHDLIDADIDTLHIKKISLNNVY
jgi:hypothetical protein